MLDMHVQGQAVSATPSTGANGFKKIGGVEGLLCKRYYRGMGKR